VYIADTGTAISALALCSTLQTDAAKVQQYNHAMQRYATFVTVGCETPPTTPHTTNVTGPAGCPATPGQGWVITSGRDAGALGDGWYKDMLNVGAYTIATATTGSCAFVEMEQLGLAPLKPSTSSLATAAANAVEWLLNSRSPDGVIPYIIDPPYVFAPALAAQAHCYFFSHHRDR
jgi:hypothetical protein